MEENKLNEAGYTETIQPRLASEMTLREHYAGLALQGMLANHLRSGEFEQFAEAAVCCADALIQALNKKP